MNHTHTLFEKCHGSAFDGRFTLKGTKRVYAPDRTFETEHIALDVALDLDRQSMKAVCRTTLRAITNKVTTMTFDAVNFTIQKVIWNGVKTSFAYRKGKLVVKAKKPVPEGETVSVEIHYRVTKPKMGLFFLKPDRAYPHRPTQVWTQGQDEYARYWFPCNDTPGQRTTTEVTATVPAGFTAVSNGELRKVRHNKKEKTSTFHWFQKIPHAPYLVTLTVGRFRVIKDKWKNIPITYYCEKGREDDTKRAFGKTPLMLDFFSRSIGVTYPYSKYAQVAVSEFIYGGMENTTATTQTDTALLDKRAALDYSSDELVAHELAHQWFGDYLTCKDWSHAWLNESFATYFETLFKKHNRGEDEYFYAIYQNAEEYFGEDRERYRRPLVTNLFKSPTDIFDRHLYEKGSVVLYMLHQQLGDDLFWKSIRTYVKDNAAQTVETVDLIQAIEKATGRNMRPFFDQWVYSAGHPTFQIRSWWNAKERKVHFRINQANANGGEPGLFQIHTEFLIQTAKEERRFKVTLDQKSQHFSFGCGSEPLMILFDPDHRLLKRLSFPRPESLLIRQLAQAAHPLARIEAAQALAHVGSEKSQLALREALGKDPFWGVQAEVAEALGQMRSEKTALILLNSLSVVEHPKVRRAIYAALRTFKSETVANQIAKCFRKEKSYFAEANGYRTLGSMGYSHMEDLCQDALESQSWNHILRMAALDGLAQLKSRDLIPLFLKHTKWGQPHRVRMAAIRALSQLQPIGTDIQNRLVELTQDPFLLVQITAVQALRHVGDERVVPALKKLTQGDWDGRLKRLSEEAIAKIMKGIE